MIVRCDSCSSAYSVNDEKVANKKFAFKCPKCGDETIIDNRVKPKEEKLPVVDDSIFNDEFDNTNDIPAEKKNDIPESEDHEDDLFDNIPDDPDAVPAKAKSTRPKTAPEDDLFADMSDEPDGAPAAGKIPGHKRTPHDDLFDEELPDKDFDDLLNPKPSPVSGNMETVTEKPSAKHSEDEGLITDELDIPFDENDIDADLLLNRPSKKENKPGDHKPSGDGKYPKRTGEDGDLIIEDELSADFSFDDEEPSTEQAESDRDIKLKNQDDIDALFAVIGDEAPAIKKNGDDSLLSEDDIPSDFDLMDADLIDSEPQIQKKLSDTEHSKHSAAKVNADDDITIDMDSLDLDLAEEPEFKEVHKIEEPEIPAGKTMLHAVSDEDITIDLDSLDIDLAEPEHRTAEPAPETMHEKPALSDDDDITIDMDSLDIDIDEEPAEPVPAKAEKPGKIQIPEEIKFEDEDEEELKLNLDELDIDIEELEKKELVFEDDVPEEIAPKKDKKKLIAEAMAKDDDEDESITIDLDTLDIDITEPAGVMSSEIHEDDEKLTLDDAGLTFDELASEIKKSDLHDAEEDDIKLTLDEIDPELTLDKIVTSAPVEKALITESLHELPEINMDDYDAIIREEEMRLTDDMRPSIRSQAIPGPDEDFLFQDETEVPAAGLSDYGMTDTYEETGEYVYSKKGSTSFSLDYSLKYSRMGALARLSGLYLLYIIPHFIVMSVYSILSSILGFINQIVILSTGQCVEDFSQITENTLRYSLYIQTAIVGIVEDDPVYAGRDKINHPLQLDVTYPFKYSKLFACLRLSILGIIIAALPHIVIMSVLTLTIPFVYLTGIFSVLITRRWPNMLFNYLTRYFRHMAMVSSFMLGLTDEYPPFRFE